jgi:hypothetical protein
MKKRSSLISIAGAVAAVGASIVLPSPAHAAGYSYIGSNSGGANARSCSSTACSFRFYLYNGRAVQMICWRDGQVVSPPNSDYTSGRWFLVATTDSGARGFVHSSLIEGQVSVRRCNADNIYG